jgi:hypothetical protein
VAELAAAIVAVSVSEEQLAAHAGTLAPRAAEQIEADARAVLADAEPSASRRASFAAVPPMPSSAFAC